LVVIVANLAFVFDFVQYYCTRRKRNVFSRPEVGGARRIAELALCPACSKRNDCEALKTLTRAINEFGVTAPVLECPDFIKEEQTEEEW
jgi:hypothetical protein